MGDISCGRLILHCNWGPFCGSGLILDLRHSPPVVVSALLFLVVWFAVELFDVNYQVVKSSEIQAANNALGARTAFMQLHLED